MPQPAYRDSNYYNRALSMPEMRTVYPKEVYRQPNYVTPEQFRQRVPNQKKIKRNLFIHRVISLVFFTLLAIFILPAMFNKYIKPLSEYYYGL